MLTHLKLTVRVLHMLMHLSLGHMTLLPGEFYPALNFSLNWTYCARWTHIMLCPKFLAFKKY